MTRNYPQFFTICRVFGLEKDELAAEVSGGRTASLRSLTDPEWIDLMDKLQAMQRTNTPADWKPKPGDVQRKKMISIARQMGWNLKDGMDKGIDQVMARLNGWTMKQKFKKELMKHTVSELNVLVSIFEEKVYKSYLEDLNK